MQTLALVDKALEHEAELASVGHEGTRQLAIATGLYPAAVAVPQWVSFGFASLFDTLGMTVPFQQVSLEAGQRFVNRLVERFGRSRRALWLFPEPEAVANASLEDLRAAGLSTAKAATLRHAAALIVGGTLNDVEIERLPSGEALRLLDDLPGIGPWTAGVILLRGFGRLDVFPHGDVGARRTLSHLLGRTSPIGDADEADLVEQLGPYRGLVYFLGLALSRGLVAAE